MSFSFLLSIPTMVAAAGYDLLKFIRHPEDGGPASMLRMGSHGISILAIGFVVSFFVAWGVVAWFMNWGAAEAVHPLLFTGFAWELAC